MCPLWQTCNQVTDFTYTNINFSVKQTQIKVNNIVIYSWCFAHPCTTCTCGQVVVVAITQVTNIANFFTQQAPNKKHNLFSFLFFLGLTAFSAALIYTLHNKEILQDSRELTSGHFGYCFILAWVCVPFLLCSGVIYIHLRKKEWPEKGKQCQ